MVLGYIIWSPFQFDFAGAGTFSQGQQYHEELRRHSVDFGVANWPDFAPYSPLAYPIYDQLGLNPNHICIYIYTYLFIYLFIYLFTHNHIPYFIILEYNFQQTLLMRLQ